MGINLKNDSVIENKIQEYQVIHKNSETFENKENKENNENNENKENNEND